MTVSQRDTLGYAVLLLLSLALILWVIPHYTPEYPGYGVPASLVPNAAAGTIGVLSVLGLLTSLLKAHRHPDTGRVCIDGLMWRHLACFLIPSFALMPAMSTLGFIPSGIVFLLLMQLLCGQRKALPLVLVSTVPVAAVYALIRYALNVPLP